MAAFADFTLGVDVPVAGEFIPRPLPDPATSATVDGYTVTVDGAVPGTP